MYCTCIHSYIHMHDEFLLCIYYQIIDDRQSLKNLQKMKLSLQKIVPRSIVTQITTTATLTGNHVLYIHVHVHTYVCMYVCTLYVCV